MYDWAIEQKGKLRNRQDCRVSLQGVRQKSIAKVQVFSTLNRQPSENLNLFPLLELRARRNGTRIHSQKQIETRFYSQIKKIYTDSRAYRLSQISLSHHQPSHHRPPERAVAQGVNIPADAPPNDSAGESWDYPIDPTGGVRKNGVGEGKKNIDFSAKMGFSFFLKNEKKGSYD